MQKNYEVQALFLLLYLGGISFAKQRTNNNTSAKIFILLYGI